MSGNVNFSLGYLIDYLRDYSCITHHYLIKIASGDVIYTCNV